MPFHVGDKVRITGNVDSEESPGITYHHLTLGSLGEIVSELVLTNVDSYYVEGAVTIPGSTRVRFLQQLINASDLELVEVAVAP